MIPGLGQEICKTSLEHLVLLKNKEAIKLVRHV